MNQTFTVLAETNSGRVYLCNPCNAVVMEFENVLADFTINDFRLFYNTVISTDFEGIEKSNSHMPFRRKLIWEFPQKKIKAIFSMKEVEQLKRLLEKADSQMTLHMLNSQNLSYPNN